MKREELFNLLTTIMSPRSFKLDMDKKQVYIDLPLLPENIKYFKRNMFYLLGNPNNPQEDWESDPIFHEYKFNCEFIPIDCETIIYNNYGQLSVSDENIVDNIENKVLTKLGIDIKNDEVCIDSFRGLDKHSHNPFTKKEINFSYISSGLDYSNPDNWYLFPQHAAGLLDVFIIYPTVTYDSTKGEIIDIANIEMSKGVNNFLKVIIPIFKDLPVNLYMPKYRQLNGNFLEYNMSDYSNNTISKNDIYNAFGYFIKECAGSDNFITFSHDQGSLLNYFLATDFINSLPPELVSKWKNIWSFGIGLDDTILSHTPFIASGLPTDSGSIISWNLATPSEISKNRKNWGDGTAKCVNPITFTKTYADQVKGNNISLMNYFNDHLHQVKGTITAKVVTNTYENEIVQINLDEHNFLTDEQIEVNDYNNMGYLHNNTIGLFVENIRDNIISRYNLGAI
jgi:hypothetical protein